MKKLPYGISNYAELVEGGYYYVDKTKYIEKLENLPEKRIIFLRPRKFGKTLFTSILENYYDINKKEKFENLYGETYIGKNPTELRNKYHILRFNFSGIDTRNGENTVLGFKNKAIVSIRRFIEKYNLDFFVNEEQEAENILYNLFQAFETQKNGEKIYVIIDEYDHFANELLGFNTEQFKNLVSQNGKVRKWYEILKEGAESIVDRIFITGVAPITLDSLTSGFNIGLDITRDENFNEMLGFTKEELTEMIDNQGISKENREEILPIMKEYYDGYKFSLYGKEKIYNSNMCLYFLNAYARLNRMPEQLIDVNIASDYSKLGKMLNLCKGEERKNVIEKTIIGEGIVSEITAEFNPEMEFTEKELISMLYYLGYLTIDGEVFGKPELKIPNKVMKELYSDYFLNILSKETDLVIQESDYNEMLKEVALEGKIDKIIEILKSYLNNLSNRDYIKFDEKYVKLIFYCIAMNLKIFRLKSEMEAERRYPDILLVPKDRNKGYKSIMIEFKYLKKEEASKLKEKQDEGIKQLKNYAEIEEIKAIEGLRKYCIVTVGADVVVTEI